MQRAASQTDTAQTATDLRVVLGQLSRRLRQQSGFLDLTRSQTSVLSLLEREGPATMSALARSEGIRPQSMTAIVGALEAAGLIIGAPDPNDGRKTVLSLSESGREQFTSGRLAREDWLFRAIQTELSTAEAARLADCVELLRRLSTTP